MMTRRCSGFSLVESLICMVIMGVCILGIISGIHFCIATLQSNREWARSTEILLSEAERLSLLPWETLEKGEFSTNFSGVLYPQWNTNTNSVDEAEGNGIANSSNGNQEILSEKTGDDSDTAPSNTVYSANTLFLGTIELCPIATTNEVADGNSKNLRRARLSVAWTGATGRSRTNSLIVSLGKYNLTSFAEHPARQIPPEIVWTNALQAVSDWKERMKQAEEGR